MANKKRKPNGKASLRPRCKRSNASLDNVQVVSNNFSEILKKKWKVFKVSTFFNFNKDHLKRYEMKMTEYINARRRFNSIITYKCSFQWNGKLKLDNAYSDTLQVEVIDSQSKQVYLGYFIAWSDDAQSSQNSVLLPILLVHARAHEMHEVHLSMCRYCKLFDSDIQPVMFSFYALITFFVKLLENPRKSINISQELLSLEYKIPDCNLNDRIKLTLFLEDTTIILAVVIDNLKEKFNEITNKEIVLEFYNRIIIHILNVYQMDLMLAELYKIVFPDSYITADGQLKLNTDEAAVTILNAFSHLLPIEDLFN